MQRVYLRDWYYNAGIAGFLIVLLDGKSPDSIPNLTLGENYIEFGENLLAGFEDKFKKHSFLKLFNLQTFIQRLRKIKKELLDKKDVKKQEIEKKIEELNKVPFDGFLDSLNMPLPTDSDLDSFIKDIEKIENYLTSLSKLSIYNRLISDNKGRQFIDGFLKSKFKGILSNKVSEYINSILALKRPRGRDDLCASCQLRKAEYEFSNAISNIIGFNKDNSNWAWGFNTSNLKICPVCALIYSCAHVSFGYLNKKIDDSYLNFFYFPNENGNLKQLLDSVKIFNNILENIQEDSTVLQAMIKHLVLHITEKKATSVVENINFVEIAENPLLSGQSTRGYNVYNYTIDLDVAEFLKEVFENNNVPKGYYVIKNTYYNIEDDLLKLSITRQIDYYLLYRYFSYYLSPDKFKANYSIQSASRFILRYIIYTRRKDMKDKSEEVVKKAFANGISLRNALIEKGKENQISGLVYGFLNDLKIADREKFLDKYIRVMMAHNLSIAFGKDEMIDDDLFLQFGYSFINGLLYRPKDDKSVEGQT